MNKFDFIAIFTLLAFVFSLFSVIAIYFLSKNPYFFYKDRLEQIEKEKKYLEKKIRKLNHDLSKCEDDSLNPHNDLSF